MDVEAHARDEVIEGIGSEHAQSCRAQRRMLSHIAEADRTKAWEDTGARDMAHFVSMHLGISYWKANRWVAASHALEHLPHLSEAFSKGVIGIDKVVELTRLATPETERGLIGWAEEVSCGAIRRRADLASRATAQEVEGVQRERRLSWWYFDEGRRFGLEAELPAAQGAVVARAIQRLSESLPVMPGEKDHYYADARRADALVALASARISSDPDPDRATVVVHARLDALSGEAGAEIEGGPVIGPETAQRLACNARVQVVTEDEGGDPIRLGRLLRVPSAAMMRQLAYRDGECRFPGCGARAFTQAHHIAWWQKGGATDLQNLLLVCFFHHRLVHEHGWGVRREGDGSVSWFLPNGTRYRAGPAPPREIERRSALAASGV